MASSHLKLWSPSQANRSLPLVSRIVDDILEKGKQLHELHESDPNRDGDKLSELTWEIEQLFDELREIGCEFKGGGFKQGLVDFPSEIDGRVVLLCWEVGEPSVTWYHGCEEGYAGRRRIPSELLLDEGSQEIP